MSGGQESFYDPLHSATGFVIWLNFKLASFMKRTKTDGSAESKQKLNITMTCENLDQDERNNTSTQVTATTTEAEAEYNTGSVEMCKGGRNMKSLQTA